MSSNQNSYSPLPLGEGWGEGAPKLAESLSAEFGKGFDERNLRHMRAFFQGFPIWNAVRTELSWTHYRNLLRVENEQARNWYMEESASQNWSTRALDRQIGTLYYERLLSSRDRDPVRQEAAVQIAPLQKSPREFVRDPVLLEFLGMPDTGRLLEADLEQALINKLQAFLLELGKGFAFVARQMRISTETKDFYIDLVFYNYLLKCFVLFDLKAGELTHQDIGQMLPSPSGGRAGDEGLPSAGLFSTEVFRKNPISHPAGSESPPSFHPNLSRSHCRALMRVENNAARQFYEAATTLCRAIPAMCKLFPAPQGLSNFGKGLLG